MKNGTMQERLSELEDKALIIIDEFTDKGEDNIIELMTIDEIDRDDDGLQLYNMPTFAHITKHNMYDEYGIISLKRVGDTVFVRGAGLGELRGEEYEKELSELTVSEVIYLAVFIEILNSKKN